MCLKLREFKMYLKSQKNIYVEIFRILGEKNVSSCFMCYKLIFSVSSNNTVDKAY